MGAQVMHSALHGVRCTKSACAVCDVHSLWCAVSEPEDDDDNERCDMEVKGCETELQLYIDSQKSDDVLRFWESKKASFRVFMQ